MVTSSNKSWLSRINVALNRCVARLFVLAIAVLVFYHFWIVVAWYSCIGSTALDEHTRVTQECMDSWVYPFDVTASLIASGFGS